MGWKSCILFVGDIESGYFGTEPAHSPEKAREILRTLRHRVTGPSSKCSMHIWPKSHQIVVGAFERGAFVAQSKIIDFLEYGKNEYFTDALSLYPGGGLLVLGLQSTVDFSAFSYFKDGKFQRSFACCADRGIMRQAGEQLSEEKSIYVNAFERDGQKIFPREIAGKIMEFGIAGVADDLVFELSKRPLGVRMDQCEEDIFETELFTLKQSGFF